MKTIKLKFAVRNAREAGILLYSLDMPILSSWTVEGLTDDDMIYCYCKLAKDTDTIPLSLQMEKLREKSFIKIIND